MNEEDKNIERLVLVQLMRLNAAIFGLAIGLLIGLTIFIATNILVVKGGEVVGPHLALLGQFFIGYEVTFFGSIIGFFYGLFFGFAASYLFACLYNWLADLREKKRSDG
jgi:hypothetical protein